MFYKIGQYMVYNINSIITGCTVKNVKISQFQNPLQTKFNLQIFVCQCQIEKKQSISGDPVVSTYRQQTRPRTRQVHHRLILTKNKCKQLRQIWQSKRP